MKRALLFIQNPLERVLGYTTKKPMMGNQKTILHNTHSLRTLLFLAFFGIYGLGWGQHFIESFENPDSWSGYTTGTVTFDSGDWEFVSVFPENSSDSYDGTKACRINDDVAGASITSPAVNGVGTVSFYYHRPFGGTGTFSLEKKVGAGTWQVLSTVNFDGVTTSTLYSYDVNESANDVKIRIVNDDNTAHLTIDYFTMGVFTASGPTITTTPSSLTGFTYVEGAGPSAEQSFTVEGSNLTNDITLTPPTNWEISLTSGDPFQTSTITLPESDGNVASTTIYTRMQSGLLNVNSPFNGDIACASTGATTQNVAVDGTVTVACVVPTTQPTALVLNNETTSSIDVSFTAASPAADGYLVVRSENSSLSANPADATTYAVNDALGGGTVVAVGSSTSFTDAGLTANTTYYYFVFAYNDTACSGGPVYLISTPLTGNATTLDGPCADVDFTDAGNSTSYATITWTDATIPWQATDARGDKDLNSNEAVTLRTGSLTNTTSVAGGIGTISFDYARVFSGNSTLKVFVNGTQYGGDISVTSETSTNFSTAIDLFADIDVELRNSGSRTVINNLTWTCGASAPEIEITGNAIEIVDGDTTPEIADDTDFGNMEFASGSVAHTFTINNTGGADLTLTSVTSDNATEFAVSGTTSGTITAGNSSTFTLTFDPTALGLRTATITVASDDADENPYTFDVQGTGTNSATSDIIANAGFSYTSDIDYLSYQANPITNSSHSIGVFGITLRDGGAAADTDALSTELNDLSLSYSGTANTIRAAALFNGNAHLADGAVTANGIAFTGLSGADFTAADNSTLDLTLRVSFTTSVVDNEQLQFTITGATANASGSVFVTADAGGATSSTSGDDNRIEVVATELEYDQQPTNTNTNATMSPAVIVQAVDTNSNLDLDYTADIEITSTGTLTGSPVTETASGGIATFNTLTHTLAQSGLTLNAEQSGSLDWDIISNSFDIIDFNYVLGDYRTTSDYSGFSHNNSSGATDKWEYFDGSNWGPTPGDKSPQNAAVTPSRIIIDHIGVDAAGNSSNEYNDIIIRNGGELILNDDNNANPLPADFIGANKTIEVLDGGKLIVQGDIALHSSANLIVRANAQMIINQDSMVNDHQMWDGVELFEGESTVEINDWDWTAPATVRSLINVVTAINDNENGYKFGHLYFNPTNLAENWAIVGGPVNVNVTENNFEINNTSAFYVLVMSNKTPGISTTFGGDVIVHDGSITLGGSFSTDNYDQEININGDLIINSDDDFYIHHAFNGTPTISSGDGRVSIGGSLEVWSLTNVVNSHVDTKELLFTGNTSHTIEIAPNCENTPIIIETGDTAELINENLKFTGNCKLEIETGATFNFGFDGSTALEVQNISGGSNEFIQNGGAYLYITHPEGIWDASSNGNVQSFSASNTTYTQSNSTYHYVGKTNQQTGDAFTLGSTSKTIICDLVNNTDELSVTSTTGTSNLLDVRNGVVVNFDAANIFGSGNLSISNGGLKTSVLSTTGTVPLLTGSYLISGGFIELNAAGDQELRGSRDYRNLTFSVSGTKTLTSAITAMEGTILVQDAAIVDVENKTLGNSTSPTLVDLTMEDTSEYKTAGTSTKPDAAGTYNLGIGTKVTFTNNESTWENIRLEPDYYNIDIEGTSVGNASYLTGISLQSGGTFTVKNGGVFKLKNEAGFTGSTATAISNTNNPTVSLEVGSTVEFATDNGNNQTITLFSPHYTNLGISGTGVKTLGDATGIVVNEDMSVDTAKLLIGASEAITVQYAISNNGEIEVAHQGSLVQKHTGADANPAGTGNYMVHKQTTAYTEYDYTYWSSPVFGETIGDAFNTNSTLSTTGSTNNDDFSPANHIYWLDTSAFNDGDDTDEYDDEGDDWIPAGASEPMEIGKGYIAMGAGSDFPFDAANMASGLQQSVHFDAAKINNGNIDVAVVLDNDNSDGFTNQNLIGNPYPSAIDIHKFYTENATELQGTFYFWTHDGDISAANLGPDAYNFTNDDYAVASTDGSTLSQTSAPSGYGVPQHIASGQGFLVNIKDGIPANSEVTFTNAMRETGNNTNFMRATNNTIDRAWLNLTSDEGLFRQIYVGFHDNATDGFQGGQDGQRMENGSNPDFYSIMDGDARRFAIQNLATFNDSKTLNLGIEIIAAGTYEINIDHFEGIFTEGQAIYLEDTYESIIHDFANGAYSFTSEVGDAIEDRFILRFTNDTLGIDEDILNSLAVYPNPSTAIFNISLQSNEELNIEVVDLTGKIVKQHFTGNQIDLTGYAKGVYFARLSVNGAQAVKKLVLK